MNRQLQAYRNNEVATAGRMKLVVMMYDGIIRFLKECLKRMEKGDIAGRGLYISKAQRILTELHESLNMDKGGEIAANLEILYLHVMSQLTNANIHGDPGPVESAIKILAGLRDSWSRVLATEPGLPSQSARKAGRVAVEL